MKYHNIFILNNTLKTLFIVLAIYLSIVLIILLLLYLVPHLNKDSAASLKIEHENTVDFINDNSNTFILINFCGAPRVGKTTCMSGVANVLADSMQNKILNVIEDVPIIYYDVDFNRIDPLIEEAYETLEPPSITTKRLCKEVEQFKLDYDDGLSIVKGATLVRQYVDAYEAQLRNNYVYAFRSDFVRESDGTRAMPFDRKMLALKDRHEKKDYCIKRYSVIVLDEKNNYGGERSTDSKKVASEDNGTTLFMATIGHTGHETIFMLSASQEFTRDVKEHRALATAICFVRSVEEVSVHNVKRSILYAKLNRLIKKRNKRLRDLEFDLKKLDPLKRRIFEVKQKLKHLRAENYVRYNLDLYHFERDIGKDVNQCSNAQNLLFTFKIRQVFGCISRYSFDFLQDVLEEEATSSEVEKCFKNMFSDDEIIKSFLEREKAEEKESKKKAKTASKKKADKGKDGDQNG